MHPRLTSLLRHVTSPTTHLNHRIFSVFSVLSTRRQSSSTFTLSAPTTTSTSTTEQPQSKPHAWQALRQRLALESPNLDDFIRLRGKKEYSVEVGTKKIPIPKPKWMKEAIPGGEKYVMIKKPLKGSKLNTVCEEARCPNVSECWSGGETGTSTATIMILRDTCTRGCRFCNIKTSSTPPPPDPDEPARVAKTIASWGVDYVVITSVDRDDLADQGSGHFAETVRKVKELKPSMLIEALVPDFRGDTGCVEKVSVCGLDVLAHNIETVEELQGAVRDRRANFKQSLDVLKMAKEFAPGGTLTKTSIMLGCGETPDQVVRTMEKVRAAGVDVMTFGQYMRPSKRHMLVSEYVTPEAFEMYKVLGMEMADADGNGTIVYEEFISRAIHMNRMDREQHLYTAFTYFDKDNSGAGEFYIKAMIDADRTGLSSSSFSTSKPVV